MTTFLENFLKEKKNYDVAVVSCDLKLASSFYNTHDTLQGEKKRTIVNKTK